MFYLLYLLHNVTLCNMARKKITECTQIRVKLCEDEKMIIEDFKHAYQKKFKESISSDVAISEIILAYGDLIKK